MSHENTIISVTASNKIYSYVISITFEDYSTNKKQYYSDQYTISMLRITTYNIEICPKNCLILTRQVDNVRVL